MTAAQKTIEINAGPKDVYKVISDIESYPQFLSDLKNCKMLEKKGDTFRAEFTVSIIKEVSYTLDFVGVPGKSLEWKLVKGFMKKNNGSWKLEEIAKGKTRATYTVDIEMGLLVPNKVITMLAEKNFPTMLNQFKKRIEGA